MLNNSIYVTQPSLAPLSEVVDLLKGVWERGILTHNGPLVQQFEKQIKDKIGVEYFLAVANGTLALQMAIKALNLKGEIITTPFTWIATLSAIQWEGCTPVFCDIDEQTLNIDPLKIEEKITDKTCAIMPVHVFGNPSDVEAIDIIANKYNLKVIYDAAHAIGSTYKEKSLLEYGDISVTSLHATKLLNTAEGGGCITTDLNLFEKLKRIRFFGHNENKEIVEQGFNGKLTELNAALGLANIKYYDLVLEDRKHKYMLYKKLLSESKSLTFQQINFGETNYSYFPIIFQSENDLLVTMENLFLSNIYPRRYFYPSVNTFKEIIKYSPMPIAEDISSRILCLPLYWELDIINIYKISDIVRNSVK
jgi:dTDP-4-amino-4,6-dideoxygalactose transaminase